MNIPGRVQFPPDHHELLNPATREYCRSTVQRAFLVWNNLGQSNRFQDVCDYFHRLEKLERTFTPKQQGLSRQHEYCLLFTKPPTSTYLQTHYPNIYSTQKSACNYEAIKEYIADQTVRQLKTNKVQVKELKWSNNIEAVNRLMTKYCSTRQITKKQFFREFQEYAYTVGMNPTVSNVAFYIEYKIARDGDIFNENIKDVLHNLNVTGSACNFKDDEELQKLANEIVTESNVDENFTMKKTKSDKHSENALTRKPNGINELNNNFNSTVLDKRIAKIWAPIPKFMPKTNKVNNKENILQYICNADKNCDSGFKAASVENEDFNNNKENKHNNLYGINSTSTSVNCFNYKNGHYRKIYL